MRFVRLTKPRNQGDVWVNPLLVRSMTPNKYSGTTQIAFNTERMNDEIEVCEPASQIARWVQQGGQDANEG